MINYNSDYLTKHLITYIGNKRNLLPFIDNVITDIKKELGKDNPSMFDGFSGSGCVARLFKHYASELYVNDLENYSETINNCYLANQSELNLNQIKYYIDVCNEDINALDKIREEIGFIAKNYAPKDDKNIQPGERVFYTCFNAKAIDHTRKLIGDMVPPELIQFTLAPLLIKASIHNNTSGVFKGFHKKDGIGHFGGKGENALKRIMSNISLDYPIFSDHECPFKVFKENTNELVDKLPEIDIAYYDPPYNQHPYGSNYFMLNIINDYNDPKIQDGVSGIIEDWNKSDYNKKHQAKLAMEELIAKTKAKYIVISYNNEGIIPIDEFKEILSKHGEVNLRTQEYNTYRGAKNTGNGKTLLSGESRPLKVSEMLWILKK